MKAQEKETAGAFDVVSPALTQKQKHQSRDSRHPPTHLMFLIAGCFISLVSFGFETQ